MGNVKYRIDEKLQVVREYERGTCGYKRLARKYNLSRDTVRAWVLSPKLQQQVQTPVIKKKPVNEEKEIAYYKAAVAPAAALAD